VADLSLSQRPRSPRPPPSPQTANPILPAALSPLRPQETTLPSFDSPEIGRHSSPRNSPHSSHSFTRDATPSRFNDTSPSSALTPHGAKTPRFDSPLASLDLNAAPATPAANQDAAERRKAHLLGTLRSTAKHTLARGTPHPTRSARKASPRSVGGEGEDAHDRTSSSFGSDRSSNDLTTFHKANTSLPSGGSADVGGAVGNGARSSRFNGAKLNAYLHSLNTHLTEENKSLAQAVSKVSKDYERMEVENRRLNDTVREMSMTGGVTLDFSRRRTTSIEEEDEGERSRVEMLGEELEGLVAGQRRIRTLQDQVGGTDGGEVLELRERLQAAEAELGATRSTLKQAQANPAPDAGNASAAADDSQVVEGLRVECEELRAERDEAKKQLEDQETEFAEATKQLEEDLCKVTEAQEASLDQARKRLDELESLRREDSALRKGDGEKIARLEAERDELERQLLEGGTDAAKEMEEKVHSLRGEVAQLEETIRGLRSDVVARDEALEKMQEEVEEAERRVEELELEGGEVVELRRQIVEKDAELQQLDEAFEDSAQQLVQHEDTIDALQKQLGEEQKKSSALSAQYSQLSLPKTKSPLANEVYNSAKDEIISSLEEELGEARREVDEMREKLATAQQATIDAELRELELKKLQEDKANLEGRIKSLREQSVLFSPSNTPDKSWMLRPLPSVLTPRTPGQFLSNVRLSFPFPPCLLH
jgi:chromosome segregation ATPase